MLIFTWNELSIKNLVVRNSQPSILT